MKFSEIFFVILCSVLVFSCKNEAKEPEIKTIETKKEKVVHTSAAIKTQFDDEKLAAIFTQYVALKTALVNTDATAAANQASNLLTAMSNVGVAEETFRKVQAIVDNEEIEAQRNAFVSVTEIVEKMLDGAIADGKIYKQYCPMAFNNEGAYWLSESKEIRNPYFGDKMLKCGRVAEEIE